MIRLFAGKDIGVTLADYSKSGDLNNDYTTSVSYAALIFSEAGETAGPIGLSAAGAGPAARARPFQPAARTWRRVDSARR